MQKTKTFHNLVLGISVLPALMVMPAMAADADLKTLTQTTTVLFDDYTDYTKYDVISVETTDERALWVKNDVAQEAEFNIGNKDAKITFSANGGDDITGRAVNVYRGTTTLTGNEITLSSQNGQALAVMEQAKLNIDGQTVKITSDVPEFFAAIHVAGNGKGEPQVKINADDIDITGADSGIAAMSKGQIDINGNTHIAGGEEAIVARGGSVVNINADGEHTTQIDGNVGFDYDAATSGIDVNAIVNINLVGEDSYWKGNTIIQYSLPKPSDEKLTVDGMSLTIKDGAVWEATKIEDTEDKVYIALNNLNVDGGIVNIVDAERGITVDKATVSNATFNGGMVTVNDTMTVASGASVFNSDILGADGALVIKDGATLNIGDSIVNVDKVDLNGTMIANLTGRDNKEAIVTAEQFVGKGKMSLIAKSEGEYKVFGKAIFAGDKKVDINSVLYHTDWEDDGTVKLGLKSVEDIAGDNKLSAAASQTVMNLVNSSSDKLNDFGLLVQESLSKNDSAAVEKAHKAINPEETSAAQSVASQVQGTVAKLAANRMSMPSVGRNGGDVDVTAGGVWAQGLFNKSKLNGEFNGYTRGVAAGIDGTINRAFTIGAGYAFNHSDLSLNSRDTEIDSNTVFVYGQYKPSAWYANATLNYTMSDYTEKGSALGVAIDSDYKVNSFGGQVMTGYDFANGLTPEVGVRYMHIKGDSYSNSLGIQNKIDDADYLTAILGGKYAKSFAISDDLALRPEVRLAAKYDLMSDDAVTTVAMPGVSAYSIAGDRLNRFGGEAGLGITMSYKTVDLSLTYDIEVRKDYTSQTGMLKARYNF